MKLVIRRHRYNRATSVREHWLQTKVQELYCRARRYEQNATSENAFSWKRITEGV